MCDLGVVIILVFLFFCLFALKGSNDDNNGVEKKEMCVYKWLEGWISRGNYCVS